MELLKTIGQIHETGWEPDYGVESEGFRRRQRLGALFASRHSISGWGGRGACILCCAYYSKVTSVAESYRRRNLPGGSTRDLVQDIRYG